MGGTLFPVPRTVPGKAMQDAQHPVEGAEIEHTDLSVGNDRFIAGEQVHDGVLEGEQQDTGQDGVNNAHPQGDKGALFDTVDLARTKVLTHKRGGRHAEARHRHNVEAIHFHIGGKACHGSGTIAVDADLHQHIGKGDDHVLDTGWAGPP